MPAGRGQASKKPARKPAKKQDFRERLKITPEKASPEHKSKSIGKSAVDGKWYGWSHRAYAGFTTKDAAKRFARSVS